MKLHMGFLVKIFLCLAFLSGSAFFVRAQNPRNALFYTTDKPDSVRSFLAHPKKIGTLVPTWYSVDARCFRIASRSAN